FFQRVRKLEEIFYGGVPTTSRNAPVRQGFRVRMLRTSTPTRVSHTAIADRLILWLRAGSGHARRFVDVVTYIVVVALAAYLFDHDAEQDEAVIAVPPLAARLELQRPVAVQLDVIVEGAQLQPVDLKLRAENVSGPAGVRQQMIDRDLAGDVLVGVIGQVFPQRIVEPQLTRLHELQRRRGGEHLVHGAVTKAGLRPVRGRGSGSASPVASGGAGRAVLGDQHRPG